MEDNFEPHAICDKCGCEFPADQSMSHPETEDGDYCFECFDEIEYERSIKRGVAWLKENLPSMEEFMRGFRRIAKGSSLNPQILENNCHAAAHTLVEMVKKKMEIKLERGHWVAADVRESEKPFQQHSWTSVRVPDNNVIFIVDPTQWVFTGANPELCISNEDDRRYDIGGYRVKRALLGERKMPERKGKLMRTGLSKVAREWLNNAAERDWSKWTIDEMFVIANMDPRTMSGNAKEIFTTIIKSGNAGLIPIEGRDLAGV